MHDNAGSGRLLNASWETFNAGHSAFKGGSFQCWRKRLPRLAQSKIKQVTTMPVSVLHQTVDQSLGHVVLLKFPGKEMWLAGISGG